MSVQIRLLAEGDEAVFGEIAAGVFDHSVDRETAARYVADPRHHLAVAVADRAVVGFVSGVHYFHPDKPVPELFINEVGVAPSYQGRGVGKQLVAAMLRHARALGCREAWVLTERDNSAAKRLYAASGGAAAPEVMFSFDLRD